MNVTELCVNCKQNNLCTMCWKTSKKKCPHFIQKTNADRIRAMSDEELAYWIARTQIGAIKDAMTILRLPYDERDEIVEIGKTEALEWLKQPAEVTDNG